MANRARVNALRVNGSAGAPSLQVLAGAAALATAAIGTSTLRGSGTVLLTGAAPTAAAVVTASTLAPSGAAPFTGTAPRATTGAGAAAFMLPFAGTLAAKGLATRAPLGAVRLTTQAPLGAVGLTTQAPLGVRRLTFVPSS